MADDYSFLQEGADSGIPGDEPSSGAGDLSSLWNDLALNESADDGATPVDSVAFDAGSVAEVEIDIDIDIDGSADSPADGPKSSLPVADAVALRPSPFDLPGGAPPPIAPPPAPTASQAADSAPADEIEIDFDDEAHAQDLDQSTDIDLELDLGADASSVPNSILAASGLSGPESQTDMSPVQPPPVPPADSDEDPQQQAVKAASMMSSSAMARELANMAEQLEAEGQDVHAAKLWRAAALLDPLFTLATAALQRLMS